MILTENLEGSLFFKNITSIFVSLFEERKGLLRYLFKNKEVGYFKL